MSRSYRKTPVVKDHGSHKQYWKRQANKKVRRSEVESGGEFNKHFDSWNICDWRFWLKELTKKESF